MKIGKAVKWMFLGTICNLSAQNYSVDFGVNTKPTQTITINDVHFGIDYKKIFQSNYKIENELQYNSKSINYFNTNFSNSLTTFNELRNKFTVTYLKNEKINFNLKLEPFVASENNLNFSDIDLLGELSLDFILTSNKKLKVGVSRNTLFGKTLILPTFLYDYKYSEKLNLSIGFPESKASYSNNSRNVFSLKNEFNGSIYNLENSSKTSISNSTKSSFSQLTTALEYERNMDTNWYVNFKMGYDSNRKYLLLDHNYKTTLDYNIKDGYSFGITIKYKH